METKTADLERLRPLAESINEAARLARANVALVLVGALYLILTLLASSDENLLRNAVVELPGLRAGISLEWSYIVAPGVFLYLHVQTLFVLSGLARKISAFQAAIGQLRPRIGERDREEIYEWLSVTSFVRAMMRWRRFPWVAVLLSELPIGTVPFLLLVLVDLSFLRYQSTEVSAWHHLCATADWFAVLGYFRYAFPGGYAIFRELDESRRRGIWRYRLLRLMKGAYWLGTRLATVTFIGLLGCLWAWGWPLDYREIQEDGGAAAFHDGRTKIQFTDAFCKGLGWRAFCRSLRIDGSMLAGRKVNGGEGIVTDSFGKDDIDLKRRVHGISLDGRSLVGIRLENVWMPGASLRNADIQGGWFRNVTMDYADLTKSKAAGVWVEHSRLNGAVLRRTDLANALFVSSELNGADLLRARATNAKFVRTELNAARVERVKFGRAQLKDVSLAGVVGRPANTNLEQMERVTGRVEDLPAETGCREGPVPCYMEKFSGDFRLAWKAGLSIAEHLERYRVNGQLEPEWVAEYRREATTEEQ